MFCSRCYVGRILMPLIVFLVILLNLMEPSLSSAVCPFPAPRIQTLFTRSDVAFVGTVVSERGTDERGKDVKNIDKDDAVEIYYQVKVKQLFRGPKSEFIEVCEGNDSGRMGLEVGHSYLLLIKKNSLGLLEGSCTEGVESSDGNYTKDLLEVRRVIDAVKRSESGDIRGFVSTSRN